MWDDLDVPISTGMVKVPSVGVQAWILVEGDGGACVPLSMAASCSEHRCGPFHGISLLGVVALW